jgi:hypothetical protein
MLFPVAFMLECGVVFRLVIQISVALRAFTAHCILRQTAIFDPFEFLSGIHKVAPRIRRMLSLMQDGNAVNNAGACPDFPPVGRDGRYPVHCLRKSKFQDQ